MIYHQTSVDTAPRCTHQRDGATTISFGFFQRVNRHQRHIISWDDHYLAYARCQLCALTFNADELIAALEGCSKEDQAAVAELRQRILGPEVFFADYMCFQPYLDKYLDSLLTEATPEHLKEMAARINMEVAKHEIFGAT